MGQTMSKHVRQGIGRTLLLERVRWQLKAGLAFHFGSSIKRIISYVRSLPSRRGKFSGRPQFHPAPGERAPTALLRYLEALPGLQNPCGGAWSHLGTTVKFQQRSEKRL